MSRLPEVRLFEAGLDKQLGIPSDKEAVGKGGRHLARVVVRNVFTQYASLWNDAEAASDAGSLAELQALRPRLRVRPPKPTLVGRISMLVRFVVFVVAFGLGCTAVILASPLRLLHPVLQRCGVPHGWLPVDIATWLLARMTLALAGVKVQVEGSTAECWGDRPCGLVVYNHGSSLDPFVVSLVCHAAPKHVGKKVLFKLPIFGWFATLVGMVPINRSNRAKAVDTMNKVVTRLIRSRGRCVAVAPEGTRTTDGHLTLPFKKGVFHLQQQTKGPLLPIVIYGAYDLWPPSQLFCTGGTLRVKILPQQVAPGDDDASREASRLKLQQTMAACLGQHPEWGAEPLPLAARIEHLLVFSCAAAVYWAMLRALSALLAASGLTGAGAALLFAAVAALGGLVL